MNVPAANAQADLDYLWTTAEESAAEHGQSMDRNEWRLVMPVHLAEDRQEAMEDIRLGSSRVQRDYFEDTIGFAGRVDAPREKIVDKMVEEGRWIVGTPDDCIESIHRLAERSGGFGGFLVMAHDWAPREKVLHSYELLARYVMPQFQGTAASTAASNRWAADRKDQLVSGRMRALDRARQVYAERGG
jgi:limonene 1,2-monooxygenase